MSKLSIVLIVVLVILVVFIASSYLAKFSFNRNAEREIKDFFSGVENDGEIMTEKDLENLPTNIKKWLKYSGVVGKEKIRMVRLVQKADMRLEKDKSWMKVEAEQYFRIEEPGFIWKADIKMAPLIHISGRDKYEDGKGNMLIKPLSLLTVADSKGKEVDQGSLLRYLAEMMWFPSAALNNYLTWEDIDKHKSKVSMNYKDVRAEGIFTFNDKGQITNFEAERYGEFDGEYRLETWSIPVSDYKGFEGIKIPTKGNVTWKLDDGDFNWFNFEVTKVEYN